MARQENFAFLLQYLKAFPLEQVTVRSCLLFPPCGIISSSPACRIPTLQYLLNFLAEWLEVHCARDPSAWRKKRNIKANWAIPPLRVVRRHPSRHRFHRFLLKAQSQVIEWVSLLLDSRFLELVLLEDSHPIIARIESIVRGQVQAAKELSHFAAYLDDYRHLLRSRQALEKVQSASAINSKHADTRDVYIIEVLHI